ncbi:MAG: hypothetical protein JJU37_09065 [Balneolaceae bacterium]|nr:hypothetical protein [Balneolaceae bacterium]
MADIRLRKTRLQDDLDLLEQSFENRFSKAKKSMLGSVQPVEFIKKRPLQVFSAALILGLAISITRRNKKNKSEGGGSISRSPAFTGILYDEMKRIAARRAASYMSEWVDQKISSGKN